ncbi:hypothetical protein TeGR_g4838, partial [Tetraparma gracilis]
TELQRELLALGELRAPYLEALLLDRSSLARSHVLAFVDGGPARGSLQRLPAGSTAEDALRAGGRGVGDGYAVAVNGEPVEPHHRIENGDVCSVVSATDTPM